MPDFLTSVCAEKRAEVATARALCPHPATQDAVPPRAVVIGEFAVIAEVKRASPSAGAIDAQLDAPAQAVRYAAAGAAAVSVLTDGPHFGGSLDDLRAVRAALDADPAGAAVPVLRKDFVVDAYQIDEARAAGADLVLLIVAALQPGQLETLARHVRALGMTPLVEVHDPAEVPAALAATAGGGIVGVNSRDLRSLQVDLGTWERVAAVVPPGTSTPLIAESGVKTPADAARARAAGYRGVLVGEALVRAGDVAATLAAFAGAGTGVAG